MQTKTDRWWSTAAIGAVVIALCYGFARYAFGPFVPRFSETFGLTTVGVGVLGGFTTFSAFSLETAMLMQRGLYGMAGFYALGSLLGGVAGLFLGLSMMRGAA